MLLTNQNHNHDNDNEDYSPDDGARNGPDLDTTTVAGTIVVSTATIVTIISCSVISVVTILGRYSYKNGFNIVVL